MYAVIRAGGKQYRVAPGDVLRVEKLPAGDGDIVKFEAIAVSAQEGVIAPGKDAVVSAEIVESSRADKILVFHFKRKKQYKKIYGHRQPYSAVRITEIAFDGQSFKAPELPRPKKKAAPEHAEEHVTHKAKAGAHKKSGAKKPAAKPAKKAAKKSGAKGKKK
ncbi:MAG TPA: 50S ribosomal protein L21 [Verrucomicrobiae bacterium]|jgi:large subunit ribosomal protein L21|nr:50S ribosomal protein L21 [Verrucomicrobiae bacterium]